MTQKFDWEKFASPVGDPEAMREAFAYVLDTFGEGDTDEAIKMWATLIKEHYLAIWKLRADNAGRAFKAGPGTMEDCDRLAESWHRTYDEYDRGWRAKAKSIMRQGVEFLQTGDRRFPQWMLDQLGGGLIYSVEQAA